MDFGLLPAKSLKLGFFFFGWTCLGDGSDSPLFRFPMSWNREDARGTSYVVHPSCQAYLSRNDTPKADYAENT